MGSTPVENNGGRSAKAAVRWLPDTAGGLVLGVLNVSVATSFCALIFSGPLAPFLPLGLLCTLLGALVIGAVVASTSSLPGMIAVPQESPAVILALMAAAIASRMPPTASPAEAFLTVMAAIAITSLLTGSFFLALGRFQLGRLIRFIPYPVIGGCLAATGWLLVEGGFGVMLGGAFSLRHPGALAAPGAWLHWGPGLGLAILLLILLRRGSSLLHLPLLLAAAFVAFYAALPLFGTNAAGASGLGLLLGPFPDAPAWQMLDASAFAGIRWDLLAAQAGGIGAILVLSVISLLLNTSGLELAVRRDIDFNHELRTAGFANVLAGLGGGTVGYPALADTALGHRFGARGRLTGLVAAGVAAAAMFFGLHLLAWVPRAIVGGLLLYLGLAFLIEWLGAAVRKMPRADGAVLLLILAVAASIGFLQGVGTGLVAAVVLFVLRYSRVDVVRHTLDGTLFHSRVDRSPAEHRVLAQHGAETLILQLQGYLFFGTAQHLLERVRARLAAGAGPLRFVVFDFKHVTGLDASMLLGFHRLRQLAEVQRFGLVFAGLPAGFAERVEQAGLTAGGDASPRAFADLDYAAEWCEERILCAADVPRGGEPVALKELLAESFAKPGTLERLVARLERVQAAAGQVLIRQGDEPDAMYFVESGSIAVQLESAGETIRLRRMGPGAVVGEIGLYRSIRRTASVVAIEPTSAWRLSLGALRELEAGDPEVAAAFHRHMACMLAQRLADTDRALQAMMD